MCLLHRAPLIILFVFFFLACSKSTESPTVTAEFYFDAAARQDSSSFIQALTDSNRKNWKSPLSRDRLTYSVLGGVDFKIQTLSERISDDSAKVEMALTFLSIRDQRLEQTVKLFTPETLHVTLIDQENGWRVASIN